MLVHFLTANFLAPFLECKLHENRTFSFLSVTSALSGDTWQVHSKHELNEYRVEKIRLKLMTWRAA